MSAIVKPSSSTEASMRDTPSSGGSSVLTEKQHIILERVRQEVNRFVAKQIHNAIQKNPVADFEEVVNEALQSYHRRLASARKTAEKRASIPSRPLKRINLPPKEKSNSGHGVVDLSSIPVILASLSPSVLSLLTDQGSTIMMDVPSLLRCNLSRLLHRGECLFSGKTRTVIRLTNDIVVKHGRTVAHDEASILEYVALHTSIPVPKPLGTVAIDAITYVFSTFIPGQTLETRWPTLIDDEKTSIRSQLNAMVRELRQIPYTFPTPLGSLSVPHVCKHSSMTVFVSAPDICTVSAFHDFLVSRPLPGVSDSYLRWLRSVLKDEYRVVLSHGDLHPRNIMVVDDPEGKLTISGIIDWEMGGWYPEYWEMYRALNTRGGNDESDWWESLPDSILGYDHEVIERRVVEQSMRS